MIADKYGVPVTELILVGDEEKDFRTAERAGCRFVRIDRSGKREGCIGSLVELLGRLEGVG